MKKFKVLALSMAMVVFAMMALGSGEDDSKTTESVKIESSDESKNDTEKNSDEKETPTTEEKDEVKYDITDTSFEYYTNSIGSTEYYGYVEITNTGNCNLFLDDATFDLEDNDGHLLQSDSYISSAPAVIKPGEKGYFYNGLGNNLIDDSVSFDNGVNLVPQITIKKAKKEPVRYEVTDTELKEGNFGSPKVTGRVINNTDEDCSYLGLVIIFYDKKGKVLAITNTSVTDLSAGGKASFDCDAMFANDNATLDKIADYQIIAEEMYMQF